MKAIFMKKEKAGETSRLLAFLVKPYFETDSNALRIAPGAATISVKYFSTFSARPT